MLKHKKEAAIAEAEALQAAADANSETNRCELNIDSVPLVASQRTEQYVIEQLKERESILQSCDNGDQVRGG